MVVAALLRDFIFNPVGIRCSCSNELLSKPNKLERERRSKEWSYWTSSISSDLDLAADWLFLSSVLQAQGVGFGSFQNLDAKVMALYAFTIAGTVTWALQVFATVCIDTNPKLRAQRRCWDFVPLLVLLFEDVPQIALTWTLSSTFAQASGLAIFNITTSIYSLFIQFLSECFLKVNWCCIMTKDDEIMDDADEEEPMYIAKEY